MDILELRNMLAAALRALDGEEFFVSHSPRDEVKGWIQEAWLAADAFISEHPDGKYPGAHIARLIETVEYSKKLNPVARRSLQVSANILTQKVVQLLRAMLDKDNYVGIEEGAFQIAAECLCIAESSGHEATDADIRFRMLQPHELAAIPGAEAAR